MGEERDGGRNKKKLSLGKVVVGTVSKEREGRRLWCENERIDVAHKEGGREGRNGGGANQISCRQADRHPHEQHRAWIQTKK